MFDRLRDSDQQWIRKILFFDNEHFLIICCTYAQAKAFAQVQCIEMDLSFKMIQGSTNVFSIAGWNEDVKRNIVCAWHLLRNANLYRNQRLLLRLFEYGHSQSI
jgi:hypothetical protein